MIDKFSNENTSGDVQTNLNESSMNVSIASISENDSSSNSDDNNMVFSKNQSNLIHAATPNIESVVFEKCNNIVIGPKLVYNVVNKGSPVDSEQRPKECIHRKKSVLFIITITNILIVLILATTILIKYTDFCLIFCENKFSVQECLEKAKSVKVPSFDSALNETQLRIVSRTEWTADLPRREPISLKLPMERVVIAHTVSPNYTTQAMCVCQVRQIQSYHMFDRQWDDIGYNFLVCGDGAVYVGRGWDNQGAHTKGYNAKSICIAIIGSFIDVTPSPIQLLAVQKLIAEGVKLKKITENYRLYGQRQLYPTESPGQALYDVIKTWDHWTDIVE